MLDAEHAARVLDERAEPGGLAARLVALGVVDEQTLVRMLADEYRLPIADPCAADVPRAALDAVPHGLARRRHLVPIALAGGRLSVAMADPTDAAAIAELQFLSNLDVEIAVAAPSAVAAATARLYGEAPALADALAALGTPDPPAPPGALEAPPRADATTRDEPVVRYVDALLAEAVRRRASDVHVEPGEGSLRVRMRVDGMLVAVAPPPPAVAAAIVSRVKVMAQLDIAERRLPQDGRLRVAQPAGDALDVRVSILPTVHGEKLALRLLDRAQQAPRLDALGMDEQALAALRGALAHPHGLVLATGPTGSGKTTTLYAALAEFDREARNVCTVEDPVEVQLDGVNQVAVRDDVGLSFATVLRALLRQDPDVIMVGEIRDRQTADIALKAALTGHLVLSTLHTNDAPAAVTRLLDMGMPPFLVAGALVLVVAQRLVRLLCPRCAAPHPVATDALGAAGWRDAPFTPRRPVGCADCGGTGFRGRAAAYEVMAAGELLRERVVAGASTLELRRLARAEGMRTLRQAGLELAARGLTSVEEVVRVTPADGATGGPCAHANRVSVATP